MDTSSASAPLERRSALAMAWYRSVRAATNLGLWAQGGLRASGREHMPESGGVLLVSNHLSYLDVFVLGAPLGRPLNYVARSSLFVPVLGPFIRSIGGFPIDREGVGKQGLIETIRRLREGGVVALFPEGTRSEDGSLGPLKPGIAVLVNRARVPVVPAGIAGTFEALSRHRKVPRPHPLRIHYGPAIPPEALAALDKAEAVALLRHRIDQARCVALDGLARDLAARGR